MSDDRRCAEADELAIFIDEKASFRVLIPKAWDPDTGSGECPELAYLAVAALIRLAQDTDKNFYNELNSWAEKHLTKDGRPQSRQPKFN